VVFHLNKAEDSRINDATYISMLKIDVWHLDKSLKESVDWKINMVLLHEEEPKR